MASHFSKVIVKGSMKKQLNEFRPGYADEKAVKSIKHVKEVISASRELTRLDKAAPSGHEFILVDARPRENGMEVLGETSGVKPTFNTNLYNGAFGLENSGRPASNLDLAFTIGHELNHVAHFHNASYQRWANEHKNYLLAAHDISEVFAGRWESSWGNTDAYSYYGFYLERAQSHGIKFSKF